MVGISKQNIDKIKTSVPKLELEGVPFPWLSGLRTLHIIKRLWVRVLPGCAIFRLKIFRLFQEQLFTVKMGAVACPWLALSVKLYKRNVDINIGIYIYMYIIYIYIYIYKPHKPYGLVNGLVLTGWQVVALRPSKHIACLIFALILI